jgi:glycogen operon protein
MERDQHIGAWRVRDHTVERGSPLPFGATPDRDGVNFSLFSQHASAATLVLYRKGGDAPVGEIPLDPHLNRTGHIWHAWVGVGTEIEYGWRLDGPYDPQAGYRYDETLLLLDPYATALSGGGAWGEPGLRRGEEDSEHKPLERRCRVTDEPFDWEGDAPLRIPMEATVIYEMHARGYTRDDSSGVEHPGTFLGLCDKIPYLQELGVTAVELMPVAEFDENENLRHHPRTGELLRNFWGYSPISFFAPKSSFAASGPEGRQINEFRTMVKRLHEAGIEVILDVVFNHTAEGNEHGPTLSFRGIDNPVYYMLDEEGDYRNYSGCGNTLNCNHPLIRELILDCLRYWVAQMHVDGFRFDLASILGRGPDGKVLENPPLLERIAEDPVLVDTKIIAEAWDAAGLNQVGTFPAYGRWAEWNGYYRDHIRLFWRGDAGMVSPAASRICGSDDLYRQGDRKPYHSINFVTAHDGFTLNDLVSYNEKHNWDNGEENIDGELYNHSFNYGVEGPTDDPGIEAIRHRQVKNFLVTLFTSQGTPMMLGGDEFRRTQQGNNNAYCQDNEINWVDWDLCKRHEGLVRLVRLLIAFRKRHPALRRASFFDQGDSGISWHGEKTHHPDWSEQARWLAFLLDGERVPGGDDHIFVMLNASEEGRHFEVPEMGGDWYRFVDTNLDAPDDIVENETDAPNIGRHHDAYGVAGRSATVLVCPRG